MPLMHDAYHQPTYAWLNKAGKTREVAVLRDSIKRLERTAHEQLLLENESQDSFDFLHAQQEHCKRALSLLSRAVEQELQALRDELREMRQEARKTYDRESSAAAAATQAVAEAQKVLAELAASHRLEGELRQLRTEHAALQQSHDQLRDELGKPRDGASSKATASGGGGAAADAPAAEVGASEEPPATTSSDAAAGGAAALKNEWAELRAEMAAARDELASARRGEGAAAESSSERVGALEAALEASRAELTEAREEVERHRAAIQHIASLVTANSAEDEKTAAQLNERIDGAVGGVADARARQDEHVAAVEEEHVRLRAAIQHIANLVNDNSKEDEVTAARMNGRVDEVEARLAALEAHQLS